MWAHFLHDFRDKAYHPSCFHRSAVFESCVTRVVNNCCAYKCRGSKYPNKPYARQDDVCFLAHARNTVRGDLFCLARLQKVTKCMFSSIQLRLPPPILLPRTPRAEVPRVGRHDCNALRLPNPLRWGQEHRFLSHLRQRGGPQEVRAEAPSRARRPPGWHRVGMEREQRVYFCISVPGSFVLRGGPNCCKTSFVSSASFDRWPSLTLSVGVLPSTVRAFRSAAAVKISIRSATLTFLSCFAVFSPPWAAVCRNPQQCPQ